MINVPEYHSKENSPNVWRGRHLYGQTSEMRLRNRTDVTAPTAVNVVNPSTNNTGPPLVARCILCALVCIGGPPVQVAENSYIGAAI